MDQGIGKLIIANYQDTFFLVSKFAERVKITWSETECL
jgi:hypothetical protein